MEKYDGIITPFMFDNLPARGMVVRINDLAEHIPTLQTDDSVIGKSLAEMLISSATLASDLKNKSNVTLQIHSSGPVNIMVARCSAVGNLRAFAETENDEHKNMGYKELFTENSVFAISVDQGDNTKVYQSFVGLNNTSISSSMEQYFNDSVQLNTYFRVFTQKVDNTIHAGAIFMQEMPNEKKPIEADDWERLGLILDTIKPEEVITGQFTEHELLFRLFAEDDVRVFPPKELQFTIPNTRERMETALKSIGAATCKELLKEGPIEMTCEFTGRVETFNTEALKEIFKDGWKD